MAADRAIRKTGMVLRRRNHKVRAACQSVAFLCLVAAYCVYNGVTSFLLATSVGTPLEGTISTPSFLLVEDNSSSLLSRSSRRVLHVIIRENRTQVPVDEYAELTPTNAATSTNASTANNATGETPQCEPGQKADPVWLLIFYFLGILYMFLALAIVCDEFFVPALEEMSSTRRMNLSMDVAGATLMAAGGSAPELFTSLFGTFAQTDVGFGTIVGSAVFNVLFVIAMCALMSKEVLQLTWWPLFRDSFYYAIGLTVLTIFVAVISPEIIELWEAIILFVLYLGYITIMWQNENIYKAITGKELSPDNEDDEGEECKEGEEADQERPKPTKLLSASDIRTNLGKSDGVTHFRWQGTFRAGILKLMRDPESWIETAGVGIVAKIAGDADYVFRKIDTNRDGSIDKQELGRLFEILECNLTPAELDSVFNELDINGDGEICEEEFTMWYVQSEERIRAQVRQVFDEIDTNKSGTIDKQELKVLLETLDPRVTDADVDAAVAAMYKHGSTEEITFEEFDEWYRHSILFERQKKAVEEDMEGVWENLYPPWDGGVGAWIKYLLVLPLVLPLSLTIPDVRRPGMSLWCYSAFLLSILWIAFFAWLMVGWAEVIGKTLGIPDVVMGLTILAAGTSVPDMLTSVIVARRGEGDMAVSSSIGSNIFDILVGLPIPWILFTAWPTTPNVVKIISGKIYISVTILLGMLVFVIVVIHCQGWKLTKAVAASMLLFYFGFLAQAIYQEFPFDPGCV